MKIGTRRWVGRLYSQKRCDILNIDQLMNCEGKLSHSWELFCSKDQMSLRCEEAVQLAPDMWTCHDTFKILVILNLGVRCGRPGQSGQEVWDISLTPWVISEGNGFTQFKPVKNTELIGKEVPSPLILAGKVDNPFLGDVLRYWSVAICRCFLEMSEFSYLTLFYLFE